MSEYSRSAESYSGWIRLALTVGATFVLPIWFLLTAGFMQHKPFESVVAVDESGTLVIVQSPVWLRVATSMFEGAMWVALLLGFVGLLVVFWALIAKRQHAHTVRARGDYAQRSPEAFNLQTHGWRVERVDRPVEQGYEEASDVKEQS